MVSLFEWLKNLFSHDAVQRTRLPYFSELFLQKDREWFTSRFPLGYSLISHKCGDQPQGRVRERRWKEQV